MTTTTEFPLNGEWGVGLDGEKKNFCVWVSDDDSLGMIIIEISEFNKNKFSIIGPDDVPAEFDWKKLKFSRCTNIVAGALREAKSKKVPLNGKNIYGN